MSKIGNILLRGLHQQESFEFHTQVYGVVKVLTDPTVVKLTNKYKGAIDEFDDSLKQLRESADTGELARLDNARDLAWRGLNSGIKSLLNHYDSKIARNANVLDILMRNYGNPTRLSYNEETGTITNLCQELETTYYLGLLNQLHLTFWYEDMRRCNQDFSRLFIKRGTEQSVLITGLAKEKRRATDAAYRKLEGYINGLADVDGSEELKQVINRVNYYTKYYADLLSIRRGKADAKDSDNPEKTA